MRFQDFVLPHRMEIPFFPVFLRQNGCYILILIKIKLSVCLICFLISF